MELNVLTLPENICAIIKDIKVFFTFQTTLIKFTMYNALAMSTMSVGTESIVPQTSVSTYFATIPFLIVNYVLIAWHVKFANLAIILIDMEIILVKPVVDRVLKSFLGANFVMIMDNAPNVPNHTLVIWVYVTHNQEILLVILTPELPKE